MTDFEKANKYLKMILKYGDIYDNVALEKGRSFSKNPFIEANMVLFSRFFIPVVFLKQKVESKLAHADKVKQAQDEIRKILGVPVDIIRNKFNFDDALDYFFLFPFFKKKEIYLYYEKEGITNTAYLENLKKILAFSIQHNISLIYLREEDVKNFLDSSEMDAFLKKNFNRILRRSNVKSEYRKGIEFLLTKNLLELNLIELDLLIRNFRVSDVNHSEIMYFSKSLHNPSIQRAVEDFLQNEDERHLKMLVQQELTQRLNQEYIIRDKEYGKVFQTIEVRGKGLTITVQTKDGRMIRQEFQTLYEYLDIRNYKNLLDTIKRNKGDDKELLLLAAFYLYFLENKKLVLESNKRYRSIYDQIYHISKYKKANEIPGIYTKSDKYINNFFFKFFPIAVPLVLYFAVSSVNAINSEELENKKDSMIEMTIDEMISLYKASYKFEWSLIEPFIQQLKELMPSELSSVHEEMPEQSFDFFENEKDGLTGDVDYSSKEVFATITPLEENMKLPQYYAKGYASGAEYGEGSMQYYVVDSLYNLELYDAKPLFTITYSLPKDFAKHTMFSRTMLYPVDGNYVVQKVEIIDKQTPGKVFVWNLERSKKGTDLTEEEIRFLGTFLEPEITYTFGLSDTMENEFVKEMCKINPYTEHSMEEVRTAICKGLHVTEHADIDEIYEAIKAKKYSKTPIKDAKMENAIKSMDELEYLEAIATMDSTVCNLASTMAVCTNDELFYTIGYLNTDNEFISADEAHAWAMNKDGAIIDVTPNKPFEIGKVIAEVLQWGLEHHLPLYALFLFIAAKLKKKYGKKISMKIEMKNAQNVLLDPSLNSTYAKINEYLYGGIHVPSHKTPEEMVGNIKNNFGYMDKETLQKIKKELMHQKIDRTELNRMKKFLTAVPIISEHPEELRQRIKKQ